MVKIVEYEKVYLEYPDEEELTDESKEVETKKNNEAELDNVEQNSNTVTESRTTRLSLEELQQKLEETQSLHL